MFLIDFLLKLLGIRKEKAPAQPSSNGNGNGNGRGRHGRHGRHAGNGNRPQQPQKPQDRQQRSQQPARGPQQQPVRGSQPRKDQPARPQQRPNQNPKPGQNQQPKQNAQPPRPPRPQEQPPKAKLPVPAPTAEVPKSVIEAPKPIVEAPKPEVAPAAAPVPPPAEEARQIVYVVRADAKFTVLVNLLRANGAARTVVFCNKKMAAEDAHRALAVEGFKCGLLTGDVNEEDRAYILQAFTAGEMPLVVVTDGFDAGVHAGAVDFVVNYDFPYEPADYVRRIGEVGRAGHSGRVISFADEDESFAIPEIEAHLGVSLKCQMLEEDDPLLKAVENVPEDEAEPMPEPEPESEPEPAYTHIKGGVPVFDAQGHEGRVVLPGGDNPRPLPTFETALDPKNPLNEDDVYLKAIVKPYQGSEWAIESESHQDGDLSKPSPSM